MKLFLCTLLLIFICQVWTKDSDLQAIYNCIKDENENKIGCQDIFNAFDKNNDGNVSEDEAKQFLELFLKETAPLISSSSLTIDPIANLPLITDTFWRVEAKPMFLKIDQNGDHLVTFKEFIDSKLLPLIREQLTLA